MNIDITDPGYCEKTTVLQSLFEVNDPELGINIVDLGLVYGIFINEEYKTIRIEMTLSTRSCPLGGIITGHVKVAVDDAMPGYDTTVELVWEPKWNADKVSAEGKAQLGW